MLRYEILIEVLRTKLPFSFLQNLKRFLFILLLLQMSIIVHAQGNISGTILDAKSKKPIAFASVIEKGTSNGTLADIDGKFQLKPSQLPTVLVFNYLGFTKTEIIIDANNFQRISIYMEPSEYSLAEFEVKPTENPADVIMRKVIANRDKVRPEDLESYSYNTYSKIIFTSADSDTIQGTVKVDLFGKVDSSEIEARQLLREQHLFLNESVTERKFRKPASQSEVIIASRTSGMKNPLISSMVTQLQSLSFYSDFFEILGISYINPVSKGSFKHYYFDIIDTTFSGLDTVISISYTPKKPNEDNMLKGVLNINMTHFAMESASANPSSGRQSSMHIRHKFELVDSIHWFPMQQNTDVKFRGLNFNGVKLIAEARTYISNIEINPHIRRREFNAMAIDIDPNAVDKANKLLPEFRVNELSKKDSTTYEVIDSLGKVYKVDRRLNSLQALLSGKLRIKVIDIDLLRLFNYNNYEGFRFGLNLQTNEKLLRWMNFGGYIAYGTRDQALKYGGNIEFIAHRRLDVRFKLDYKRDIREAGFTEYHIDSPFSLGNIYRGFSLNVFDSIQQFEASFSMKPAANLQIRLGANYQIVNPVINAKQPEKHLYQFLPYHLYTQFRFTEFQASLRWGIKEKYISLGDINIAQRGNYPVLWLSVTQGVAAMNSDFTYTKIMAQIEETFSIRKVGKTRLLLTGGYIFGDVPYSKLFSQRGSFAPFSIVSRTAFETMSPNEFVADAFVAFFFSHNFGRLFKVKRIMQPELSVVHNLGFGWLRDINRHVITYPDIANYSANSFHIRSMEKGFFEVGLVLDKIITIQNIGLGIGAFYRYGEYRKSIDVLGDFRLKLALTLGL